MKLKIFDHYPWESLNFDLLTETVDSQRYYVTPRGKYRSVTTILSELNKSAILEWRNRVGAEEANKISSQAARKGTKFHSVVEKYLRNNLNLKDISLLNPDIKEMFLKVKPILDENISEIYGLEQALYSDELKIAGRVDLIAKYNNEISIIDHKTSSKRKEESWITNYFYQAALYAKMLEERTRIFPKQIVVSIAVANSEPQIFIKKTENYLTEAVNFVRNYHESKNC